MPVAVSRSQGDPLYYLRNFHILIDTLQRRDADLLDAQETRFIADFRLLPEASRALLVRMVMRKGPLFRATRLEYPEIAGPRDAMGPLIARGWVDERPALSIEEVFRLFRRDEIAQMLSLPKHHSKLSKAALLEELRHEFAQPRPLSSMDAASEIVYRLEIDPLCDRLRVMFFGNFRQEWSEFVLADLGIFRYECIALHVQSRPFRTRAQVEAFHRLHLCRTMLHEARDLDEVERELPAPIEDCDWLEARREKLRYQLGRARERCGEIVGALGLYATCAHPEAERRAALLRERAEGRGRRIKAAARVCPPTFEMTIEGADPGRPVETRVLESLASTSNDDTSVHYVENTLINSLFGLLCWPAVFAPVQGAFFHSFHQGPADLSCAGFFARRRREFAGCFAELRSGTYQDTILRRYEEKQGILSPFVAWGWVDEALLRLALACFPPAHLSAWFEWIASDVRTNRSGFPDLVQFWPGRAAYRLIEVKGPGDRLQDNQRRCLEHGLAHGIPVSVCHVRWV